MITQISYQNFLKSSRTFDFGPVTMLIGPNGSGKSTCLLAGRIAARGEDGEYGKQAHRLFKLASAASMSVGIMFDNGVSATRTYTQTIKKDNKAAVKAGKEIIGELPSYPESSLDVRAYMSATEPERTRMVFELKKIDFNADAVRRDVVACAGTDATASAAIAAVMAFLKDSDEAENPQRWLERTVAGLKDLVSTQTELVTQLTNAAEVVTEESTKLEAVSAGGLSVREEAYRLALSALDQARGALNTRIEQRAQAVTKHAAWLEKTANLKLQEARDLDLVDGELKAARAHRELLQHEYRVNLEAFNRERSAMETVNRLKADRDRITGAMKPLEGIEKKLEDDTYDCLQINERYGVQKTEAEARYNALNLAYQRSVAAYDADIHQIDQIRTDLGNVKALDACPTCGASGPGWRNTNIGKLRERNAPLAARTQAWESARDAEYVKVTAAYAAIEDIEVLRKVEADVAQENYNETRGRFHQLKALREELGRVNAGLDRALPSALADPTPEPAPLDVSDLTGRINALELEHATATANLQAQALRNNEPAVPALIDAAAEISALDARQADLAREAESISALAKRLSNHAAHEKTLEDARKNRLVAESLKLIYKSAYDKLAKKLDELVQAAFEPLIKTASKFVDGILPTKLEYRGEVGRSDAGIWVPLNQFSDGEKLAVAAGIMAALGTDSELGLVIVDNMDSLDPENKVTFIRNILAAMARGEIKQFIGCDVHPDPYRQFPEIRVHSFERRAAA